MPDIKREEVLALLPWLANGSLPAPDAQRVEAWLAEHSAREPDVVAELAWLRVTAGQVKANVQVPPADRGLDTLMRRVRAEAAAAQPMNMPKAAHTEHGSGLLATLQRWFTGPAAGGRMALAGLVLAQAAVIGVLLSQPTGSNQVPLSDPRLPALGDAALLQVTFAPGATEGQVRAALQQVQGTLVGGPGALGLYTVAVPRASAEVALAALRAQAGVVESVEAVPTLPAPALPTSTPPSTPTAPTSSRPPPPAR